jgi:hypothetical protein
MKPCVLHNPPNRKNGVHALSDPLLLRCACILARLLSGSKINSSPSAKKIIDSILCPIIFLTLESRTQEGCMQEHMHVDDYTPLTEHDPFGYRLALTVKSSFATTECALLAFSLFI